ncbi:unnamed protein product [Wuchereria bancrofti]|uniref:Uncharacterized protein n=2 Tax=Wuchereria bancrofti TaxID=6293 RepID=A0A3P7EFT5_WUCBA|nr:unnamed protein product [Wuchereria bancrofti]
MEHYNGVDEFVVLNEELTKWCMGMREKLLSLVIISEGRGSLDTVVRIKNWLRRTEVSIAIDLERYNKEDNNGIYTQVGDSRTATEDSIIVPRKSASFESKLINLGQVDFAFNQTSEELKSRAAQVEVEKTVADVSCQVEDLVFSIDNETFENSVKFSTNVCNETVIVRDDSGTKSMNSCSWAVNPKDADEMKNISVADGNFTYTFCQIEESDNLRSENPKPSSALISKYNDESTVAINQKFYGTQFVGNLNEVNVENDRMSQPGANLTPADVDEMVVFANAITLTGSKNTISERLRNAFRTIRLLEEGIEVDEVQCNVDIRNNKVLIASNPWPSLTDRLYRYMHNLSHRRNAIRLILRYLLVFYFILLHGAFFRCIIF